MKLALHITQASCECGNRWTHSIVTHVNGGTPGPGQIQREALEEIWVGPERKMKICFACAPGHIKPNIWRPRAASAESRATAEIRKAADIADLLK